MSFSLVDVDFYGHNLTVLTGLSLVQSHAIKPPAQQSRFAGHRLWPPEKPKWATSHPQPSYQERSTVRTMDRVTTSDQ